MKTFTVVRYCLLTLLLFLFCSISFFTNAQTEWYKYPGNPIIKGIISDWDYVKIPKVVIFENNQYHMWYKGFSSQCVCYGYAISKEGIHWNKFENNPLEFNCAGTSWEVWIGSIDIIKKDSMFYMWYTGKSKDDNKGCIGYAYSKDGLSWIKYNDPILKPSEDIEWEAKGFEGLQVFYDGIRYHMWYNGLTNEMPAIARVGYATSNDGILWKKYPENPVLDIGKPGTWEDHAAMVETLEFNGTYYEMWYHGWNLIQHEIGYATSHDGINWNKYHENPVLKAGEIGEWDSWLTTYPAVLRMDSVYRMWYYGHDNVIGMVGYATTSIPEVKAWDTIKISKQHRTIKVQVFNRTEFVKVDSIEDKLNELTGIPLVDAYNRLSLAYSLNDSKKSLRYAEKAMELAEQEKYPEGKAMTLYSMGNSQYVVDNYSDALAMHLKALHLFDSLDMIFEQGNLLSQIAGIHSYTGSYDLACRYHERALKLFELQKDTGYLLRSLIYLGNSYLLNGDTTKAINTFNRKLNLAISNKNGWSQVVAYQALGCCYSGRYLDSALYYFRIAEKIWATINPGYPVYNYMLRAEAYCAEGSEYNDHAEDYYLKSYGRAGNGRQLQVRLVYGIAEFYFNAGKYDQTREYLDAAQKLCRNYLTKQNHQMFAYLNEKLEYDKLMKHYMEKIYRLHYRLDTALNNKDMAFKHFMLATQWNDSIVNQQNRRQLAIMQGEYETERIQNQIKVLKKDNEVQILTLRKSKIYLFSMVAFVLIVVIGATIYIRNRKIKAQHSIELERVKSEKLQELDRLKSRFFANISHEFRTPLTLIMGPLEKVLSNTEKEQNKKELGIAKKYTGKLQNLINNLLSISKLESGKMQLQASELDIVKLIRRYIQAFESLAKQKNIEFKFSSKKTKIEAYIDWEKFEQILNNLLSNAFKFTGEGGEIKVAVSSTNLNCHFEASSDGEKSLGSLPLQLADSSPPSGGFGMTGKKEGREAKKCVEIKISDTGHGISPEHIKHIFDRFYQAGQENNNYYEGTGIGLALTKELVELHHGKIEVESEPGLGTTFTISLPLGKEHLKSQEIIIEKPIDIASIALPITSPDNQVEKGAFMESIPKNNNQPILLIVEDNADMRSYIRGYFENEFIVIEAIDGADGYEKTTEQIPDIIISDVMMPNMDGNEFCRKVKTDERTSHIPVILLTARASKESRMEGLETGADDFITKPFDGDELQIRIKNLIAQRRRISAVLESKIQKSHSAIKPDFEDSGITSMDEQFLQKVIEIIKKSHAEPDFNTKEFGLIIGLSVSQLNRKIKALTGETTGEFIRTYRLTRAAHLIKLKSATIAEIAYDVGFSSPSYFSECFHLHFGKLPSEFDDNK